MPKPTHGKRISELEAQVTSLSARLASLEASERERARYEIRLPGQYESDARARRVASIVDMLRTRSSVVISVKDQAEAEQLAGELAAVGVSDRVAVRIAQDRGGREG